MNGASHTAGLAAIANFSASLATTVVTSRPLNQFSAPGAVRLPLGAQDVEFLEPGDEQAEWAAFKALLDSGYRVRHTTGDGFCGVHAVYAGFKNLCQTQGWVCPSYNYVRGWMGSTRFITYVLQNAPMIAHFNYDDYVHQDWFTTFQLNMLAMWLGQKCGGATTLVKLMYVAQWTRPNDPSKGDVRHNFVHGGLPNMPGHVGEHVVYVHWQPTVVIANTPGGDLSGHYSSISRLVGDSNGIGEWEKVFDGPHAESAEAPRSNTAVRDYKKQTHIYAEPGSWLWVTGQLGVNPWTGAEGPVANAMLNKDIDKALQLGGKDSSAVSHNLTNIGKAWTSENNPLRTHRSRVRDNITVDPMVTQVANILGGIVVPTSTINAERFRELQERTQAVVVFRASPTPHPSRPIRSTRSAPRLREAPRQTSAPREATPQRSASREATPASSEASSDEVVESPKAYTNFTEYSARPWTRSQRNESPYGRDIDPRPPRSDDDSPILGPYSPRSRSAPAPDTDSE